MSQEMTPGTRSFLKRGRAEVARMGGVCVCGSQTLIGWIGNVDENCRVAVCATGEHVTVGMPQHPKVYIYVENPGDVIETVALCWLCGGVDPNETVTVAREYPGGPKCDAYKAQAHTGCWQDIQP